MNNIELTTEQILIMSALANKKLDTDIQNELLEYAIENAELKFLKLAGYICTNDNPGNGKPDHLLTLAGKARLENIARFEKLPPKQTVAKMSFTKLAQNISPTALRQLIRELVNHAEWGALDEKLVDDLYETVGNS